MLGKYSLRSMSTRTNKTKLVYINEEGNEFNLGVFKTGAAAERKMYAHRDQMQEHNDFLESVVAKPATK